MAQNNPNMQARYQTSPEGLLWRHDEIPGVLAIPFEALTTNILSVQRFMRFGRSPLVVEQDDRPMAVTFPHRRDTADLIDEAATLHVTAEQIKVLGAESVRRYLGALALVVSVDQAEDSSRIVLVRHTLEQHKDTELDFAEMLRMDMKRSTAGHATMDPETGMLFANRVLLDPLGQDLIIDLMAARQRRLGDGR